MSLVISLDTILAGSFSVFFKPIFLAKWQKVFFELSKNICINSRNCENDQGQNGKNSVFDSNYNSHIIRFT